MVGVSLEEQYRAEARLTAPCTLADFGIYPVSAWTLVATCSWHGRQSVDLPESVELPDSNSYIRCDDCFARAVTRWLVVETRERR